MALNGLIFFLKFWMSFTFSTVTVLCHQFCRALNRERFIGIWNILESGLECSLFHLGALQQVFRRKSNSLKQKQKGFLAAGAPCRILSAVGKFIDDSQAIKDVYQCLFRPAEHIVAPAHAINTTPCEPANARFRRNTFWCMKGANNRALCPSTLKAGQAFKKSGFVPGWMTRNSIWQSALSGRRQESSVASGMISLWTELSYHFYVSSGKGGKRTTL